MSQDLKIDISRAKSAAVGKENGITPAEFAEIEPKIHEVLAILRHERETAQYGFYDLYKHDDVFKKIAASAKELRDSGIENVVVLGIGGSALGVTALLTALKPPYHNLLSRKARGGPRLFVMDNIDPVTFKQMLRLCPPKKTLFNIISKKGDTAETMTQAMIAIGQIESKLGKEAVKDHVVITTNPRDAKGKSTSVLSTISDMYGGFREFSVPENVGGRFSVFTPVGMFPAAMIGIDLDGLREGCAAMDARCSLDAFEENPAALRAAVQYLADTRKGKTMSVMMPYADGLRDIADWYRQLWAESLGKKFDLDGNEVFTGQTPIKALGATDQHSQIQLYREGPNNKLINVLEVARFATTMRIPNVLEPISSLGYLRGKSMNKLMSAELRGTIEALKISQRPVCRITLPAVNENTVAQLLYMLEVETAIAGRLYNVNTFDQPAVVEGKQIAMRLMGGEA